VPRRSLVRRPSAASARACSRFPRNALRFHDVLAASSAANVKHWLQQSELMIANRELRGVDSDRDAARARCQVVPRERTLTTLVPTCAGCSARRGCAGMTRPDRSFSRKSHLEFPHPASGNVRGFVEPGAALLDPIRDDWIISSLPTDGVPKRSCAFVNVTE